MNIDKKALIGFITEIEASRERAKGETRHQSDIFKRAREKHFDVKAMRKVLQRRAMSTQDRDSLDDAVDAYELALGTLAVAKAAVDGGMSRREAAEKYNVPRAALGHVVRGSQNEISDPPHDPNTGEVHNGQEAESARQGSAVSGQPDSEDAGGGAPGAGGLRDGQDDARENGGRVRGQGTTQDQLNREVAFSGDDAGRRSEPSPPADMGIPASVNADPPLGRRPHVDSSQGEQSGTDIFAESANNESCGSTEGRTGVSDLLNENGAAEPDADAASRLRTNEAVGTRRPGLETAPVDAAVGTAGVESGPHDTVVCSVDGGGACPNTCQREGRCVWDGGGDTRGEARPNPDEDDLAIPPFLRRDSTRVVA